jgi:methylenetetrahydrofolate dehydrogenase (NADP+)/methenyltetrahydrofolate cyclohydrolase
MKLLSGAEIAGFIMERQAKQVRALRQSWRVIPRLAIIQTHDDTVSDKYVAKKIEYANDILVDVDSYKVNQNEVEELIDKLNKDNLIHGIIVQLPIEDPSQTDIIVSKIAPEKDVDGLTENSQFLPATAQAIDWLVAGYGVELFGKKIVVIGKGKLVGGPIAALWLKQNLNVLVADSKTENLELVVHDADVIVSAAGKPGLVTRKMVKPGSVVIDAGTANSNGSIVGDVADDVRELDDISITPKIGGVGPLTIAALIDNVIRAARVVADKEGQKDLG